MRAAGIALTLACASLAAQTPAVLHYAGPCDASAAVALGADAFVVGNDETNVLYVYDRNAPNAKYSISLTEFLGVKRNAEADIEGAAAVGTRVFWITSHGRDGKGRLQPSRHRFFAIDAGGGGTVSLVPVGKPYEGLLADLVAAPQLARYRLADAAKRAPEAPGGFNIEGLAATRSGGLLIGLRNPVVEGRALAIPFENPAAVVEGGAHAQFGAAYELDLGGRGIRSIEWVGESYVIVGGPIADDGTFALFRWSGARGDTPKPVQVDLGTLRPEGLTAVPNTAQVQLFSDDGGIDVQGIECKRLDPAKQSFRSLIVALP